ncbi:MAG: tRNA (5-methylaminomethyl-2-thiouridine)(34)-methyltransferase MnmD [Roseobacter sp.]
MQNQMADLAWREGNVPVSTRFDDPYFSLENGLAETRYVFLQGNRLPERFRGDFHIGELGFGTGLSFLTTVQAWEAAGCAGKLHFTSFEAFPMAPEDMAKALGAFEGAQLRKDELAALWHPEGGVIDLTPSVSLRVIIGDARETVAEWDGHADAWYLDGFSPAKNPELWDAHLMAEVAAHTSPQGSFATYTAAGFVRRALDEAGFEVERIAGFGRKRHMTRGVLRV